MGFFHLERKIGKANLLTNLDTSLCLNWFRLSKLEMLDEIEELDLLLSHYSVTWAYTQPDGMDFSQSIKQFDGIS